MADFLQANAKTFEELKWKPKAVKSPTGNGYYRNVPMSLSLQDQGSGAASVFLATVNSEVCAHPKDRIIVPLEVLPHRNEYPLANTASTRHGLSDLHADKL